MRGWRACSFRTYDRVSGAAAIGVRADLAVLHRFRSLNHIDITDRPRPEERAPKSGLPDFGNQQCRNRQQPISMRASRRTAAGEIVLTAILRDAVLRTAPQDEVCG
jgi:hypothetical protein